VLLKVNFRVIHHHTETSKFMIAWTFKNKLKSLDDIEFLNYFRNRDGYSHKLVRMIEQEARNRYFSNKEFNGQDDEYMHPVLESQRKERIHNTIRKSTVSFALVFVMAAAFYFIPVDYFPKITYSNVAGQIAQWYGQLGGKPSGTVAVTASDDDRKNQEIHVSDIEDREAKPVEKKIHKTEVEKSTNGEMDKKTVVDEKPASTAVTTLKSKPQPDIEKPVEIKKDVITHSPVPEPFDKNEQTKTIVENSPEKKIEPSVAQEKTQEQTAVQPPFDSELALSKDSATALMEKKTTEKDIVRSPDQNEPHQISNEITSAQMLSTSQLRLYIPFLNDWAFKQTRQADITDYFVESNSIVSFKISKEQSAFIETFKDPKTQLLMQSYWKNLDAELGSDFPRIAIEIKFLRFDDDL
jgi:hypothetical protein